MRAKGKDFDKMKQAFYKVEACIKSCKQPAQLVSAWRLVNLFAERFGDHESYAWTLSEMLIGTNRSFQRMEHLHK